MFCDSSLPETTGGVTTHAAVPADAAVRVRPAGPTYAAALAAVGATSSMNLLPLLLMFRVLVPLQ